MINKHHNFDLISLFVQSSNCTSEILIDQESIQASSPFETYGSIRSYNFLRRKTSTLTRHPIHTFSVDFSSTNNGTPSETIIAHFWTRCLGSYYGCQSPRSHFEVNSLLLKYNERQECTSISVAFFRGSSFKRPVQV